MTSPNTTHPRAAAAAATPFPDLVRADGDATVVTVGTFAAGQSDEGRYVAASEARHGSFAAGLAAPEATSDAD